MLIIEDLTVKYRNGCGIFDINLTLEPATAYTLIGPSGCGKSTLLHVLAGLTAPTSGKIRSPKKRGTPHAAGLVQQKDALFPWLTVRENIDLGFRCRRKRDPTFSAEDQKNSAAKLSDNLGIASLQTRYPLSLSGGERQRVSLARTLAASPDLLLLDEPTAALDAFTKERLQDLLLTLHKNSPVTSVFVTHDIEEALFLGRTVLIMGKGGLKYRWNNPLYPDSNARNHTDFYKQVLELRKMLGEVQE